MNLPARPVTKILQFDILRYARSDKMIPNGYKLRQSWKKIQKTNMGKYTAVKPAENQTGKDKLVIRFCQKQTETV